MTDSYKFLENSRSRDGDALVCLGNSSDTPLLANATFTGTVDNLYAYSTISVNVVADAHATLYVEQSSNGTHFDHVKHFSVLPNEPESHSITVVARFVRCRLVAGTQNMTMLRMQTIAHMHKAVQTNIVSGKTSVFEDADVQLCRVVNNLDLDEVLGRHASRRKVRIQCYAPQIKLLKEMLRDNADGTSDYSFPTTAEAVRIKSGGNANDTVSGSGARRLRICGLNASWEHVEEEIETNGALASQPTATSWARVFCAEVISSGAYGGNSAGNIVIEAVSGRVECFIRPSENQSYKSLYTVPVGKTCYLKSLTSSVPSDKLGYADLYCRQQADKGSAPYAPVISCVKWQCQGTANASDEIRYAVAFPEKTDIWISARANGGVIDHFFATYELLELDNDQ